MTPVIRLSRSRIDEALTGSAIAPHWHRLLVAVRDHNVRLLRVDQSGHPFRIADGAPTIVVIGDDLAEAKGPAAFHRYSLERVLKRANGVVVVSSAALPEVYALVGQLAASVGAILSARARSLNCTILIETRLMQEAAWLALAKRYSPGAPILISTVKRGTA